MISGQTPQCDTDLLLPNQSSICSYGLDDGSIVRQFPSFLAVYRIVEETIELGQSFPIVASRSCAFPGAKIAYILYSGDLFLIQNGESVLMARFAPSFSLGPMSSRGIMIAISCLEKYVCIINTETLQKRILALESEPIIDLMFVDDFLIVLSTLRILFVSTSENLVLEYMLDLPIDPGSHLLAVANRAGVFMENQILWVYPNEEFSKLFGYKVEISFDCHPVGTSRHWNYDFQYLNSIVSSTITDENFYYLYGVHENGTFFKFSINSSSFGVTAFPIYTECHFSRVTVLKDNLLALECTSGQFQILDIEDDNCKICELGSILKDLDACYNLHTSSKSLGTLEIYGSHGIERHHSTLSIYRNDVRLHNIFRSDQSFRGCCGIWVLKQFSTDKHFSILVATFAKNTFLFSMTLDSSNGPCLEEVSQYSAIELSSKTITIDNSRNGQAFIQVCQDMINIFKSSIRHEQAGGKVVAKLKLPAGTRLSVSKILFGELIFSLDSAVGKFFIHRCTLGRNREIIIAPISVLDTPKGTFNFVIDEKQMESCESSLNLEFRIIFCIANELEVQSIFLADIHIDQNDVSIKDVLKLDLESGDFTNEISISENVFGKRLIIGTRRGELLIYDLCGICINFLQRLTIGPRPTSMIITGTAKKHVIAMAGPAKVITETALGRFKTDFLLERSDYLAVWNDADDSPRVKNIDSQMFKLISNEHQSLSFFSSNLKASTSVFAHRKGKKGSKITKIVGNYILNACSSNEFHTEERLYLFNRISGDSLGYNHFPLGDRIQCITRLGSAEFCAVGFDIRALGQIVIYKLPALVTSERVNTKKTTGGTIYSPKSTSTCPLITWCSVGMSHPISHIVNLRVINNESINSDDENKFLHLLVAAGNELHIVKFDLIEKNLEIVYSEIWRSAITSLASSGQDTTFAVGTVRTGMDIYRYNGRCDNSIEGGTAFVLLWSAAIPDQVNDSTWLTGSKNLVIADRRGKLIIHNTDTHQRVIKHLPNKDIPLAVCGISEAEFICSAVTGALFKITLTDYS